jgi:hypothetical protein
VFVFTPRRSMDLVVGFATGPNLSALEAADSVPSACGRSPFTAALLEQLELHGHDMDAGRLLEVVRDRVVEMTGRRQTPCTTASRGRDLLFLVPSMSTLVLGPGLSMGDAVRPLVEAFEAQVGFATVSAPVVRFSSLCHFCGAGQITLGLLG